MAIPRGAEFHGLNTQLMGKGKNIYIFSFDKPAKHSKQGKRAGDLTIHDFPENMKICPVNTLNAYLKMTKPWRETNNTTQLFISHIKPHEAVETCTFARWVKDMLKIARSASSSKAKTGHSNPHGRNTTTNQHT